MTKKVKITVIILISVLLLAAVLSTSLTYAIWYGGGETTGETTEFGPVFDSTNWSVYAKSFTYEPIKDSSNNVIGLAITGFSLENLEDIIIPKQITTTEYGTKKVLQIKNIFSNDTQRKLPVTVKIPNTVVYISNSTFQNCEYLQTVIFASYDSQTKTTADVTCECGEYLFAGCSALEHVYVEGNRQVKFGDYDFIGCDALKTAPQKRDVYIAFGDSGSTNKITGLASEITYSTNAKFGAKFS